MPPFDVKSAFDLGSLGTLDASHLWQLCLRMFLAAALGAFVAFRVWRKALPRLFAFCSRSSLQGAQSQTLIAAAAVLIIVVISDNVARAFGLVGLGSFIRFRAGLSDPRDAAIMFVMIGIGMACGLGLPLLAVGATAIMSTLLILLDATAKHGTRRTNVSISAEDPALVQKHLARIFPGGRVLEISNNTPELGKDSGKVVLELDLKTTLDAASLREILTTENVPGIRRVAFLD